MKFHAFFYCSRIERLMVSHRVANLFFAALASRNKIFLLSSKWTHLTRIYQLFSIKVWKKGEKMFYALSFIAIEVQCTACNAIRLITALKIARGYKFSSL